MTTNRVILVGETQRHHAKNLIEQAPPNAVVTIKEATRTLLQNAKLWAMLNDISKAEPEGRKLTPDIWKAAFMVSCGHQIIFEHGIDGGPPFPVGFRSSKLTIPQMNDLIECMYEYGARHGIVWSDENRRAA